MRSRISPLRAVLLGLLVALCSPAWGAAAQPESAPITEDDVRRAMAEVRKDPNLATERSIRSLHWVETDQPKRTRKSGWLDWLGNLFGWFASSGRFLFWGLLAVMAAFLILYLVRLTGSWRAAGRAQRLGVPSFVRDLDIRPESLPPDIGAAARKSWDEGEHRAALALLYRGLLSRLVHVHNVPIKDSTTEGDCIDLASRHLSAEDRRIYVRSLVRLWERAVYGGEAVPTESVHVLCDQFGQMLDAPEVSPTAAPTAAAGAST